MCQWQDCCEGSGGGRGSASRFRIDGLKPVERGHECGRKGGAVVDKLKVVLPEDIHGDGTMVAELRPLIMGANLNGSEPGSPRLRDKNVIEVERPPLVAVQMERRSSFRAVGFIGVQMIGADESAFFEEAYDIGMVPGLPARVPNRVAIKIPGDDDGMPIVEPFRVRHEGSIDLPDVGLLLLTRWAGAGPNRNQVERRV